MEDDAWQREQWRRYLPCPGDEIERLRARDDSDKVLLWFEMLHQRMTAMNVKLDRIDGLLAGIRADVKWNIEGDKQ